MMSPLSVLNARLGPMAAFSVAFFAVLCGLASPSSLKAEENRPNILFIYTDDQSQRTVSCYPEAYDWVRTPHIDRLAERGVRFTHAYIGTWCMPSRATLLTGHQQHAIESMRMVGPYPGGTYDPGQCPFWPKTFRENGYVTGQIGKWHTGTDAGFGRDWDYQAVWNRPKYTENAPKYYDNQLISFNGGEAELVEGYSTDNYTRWAEEFIRGDHRDVDKPWYLWLCYGAVHGPYIPAERHQQAYPDARVPIPYDIYPPRPGKPAYMQKIEYWLKGANGQPVRNQNGKPDESQKTLNEWVRQYHQGVLAIDEGVGRLMKVLQETGQLENTLVVFTSDQGFAWGQRGFRTKVAPYEATLRAPLIVSLPGSLPEGAVCETPVGGVDLVPTFFSFAKVEPPWAFHGHDLTPLLHERAAKWPHPLLLTYTGADFGSATSEIPVDPEDYRTGVPWWAFLREGRYKYIRSLVPDEIEELYDVKNDPEERTNLALDPSYREQLSRFRDATVAELRRTNAPMVDHLPPVKLAVESKSRAN